MFFRSLLYVLCCAVSMPVLYAQDSARMCGFGVEVNALAGKIIRHSAKFTAPVPPMSSAMDINFIWQTHGTRSWQQRCHFPIVGVGLTYTNYGSNAVFGQCVGAYPNLQLPFVRGKKIEWTGRFGVGIAYVTRKYQDHPTYDTLNTAVSTHVNAFAIAMTDLRYHLNKHWDIQVGAGLTHISNALYREPNLGVNMVCGHVGIRYFPTTSCPKPTIKELPKLPNRWLFEVRAALSFKEARATGSPVEPAYITALSVSKRWHGRNKFYAGFDYVYHKDVYAFLKNYGIAIGDEPQNSWDGSFFVGNEFLIGRVGLVTQLGLYYHQTFLDFDPVFEKLGGKYYLLQQEHGLVKELFITALLTAHGAVAEYSEFGIGFGI